MLLELTGSTEKNEIIKIYYIDLFKPSKSHQLRAFQMSLFLTTNKFHVVVSQPAIICSKLTIKTLEQGVKYVQS